ncbi:MAG: CheY-like chemotaxis protein/ribonuclease BN (tRNA processing enzyme) [Chlamydiales bacterium]|jgi:CheY-like chemotaxis protein/ribonuclease BN (tRNA processing enzyme)
MTSKEIGPKTSESLDDSIINKMNHDLRIPLNVILGYTDIILNSELSDEQRLELETVSSSAHSLLATLNNFVSLFQLDSQTVPLQNKEFSLLDKLENTITELSPRAEKKGLVLSLDIPPVMPDKLKGDPQRISQIFKNILEIAIYYSENREIRTELCIESQENGSIQIRFSIPSSDSLFGKEKISKILTLEDAKQSIIENPGAPVLQACTAYHITKLLSGKIWSDIEKGHFHLTHLILPFTSEIKDEAEGKKSELLPQVNFSQKEEHSYLRVLVVEDCLMNQKILCSFLEKNGHSATPASDGKTAISLFSEYPFDMILLDIHLPDMSGYDVASSIREAEINFTRDGDTDRPEKCKIIATTANENHEEYTIQSSDIDDFLLKPFSETALVNTIRTGNPFHPPTHGNNDLGDLPQSDFNPNIFDLESFLQRLGSSHPHADSYIEAFIQHDAPSNLGALEAAIKVGDREIIKTCAHTIKVAASFIFANDLFDVVLTLEKIAPEGSIEDIKENFKKLKAQFDTLVEHLSIINMGTGGEMTTPETGDSISEENTGANIADGNKTAKRILIVEDLKIYSQGMVNALRQLGYITEVAEDGEIALEKIECFKPDLIILDIMLPKFHGIEVIKIMKKEKKNQDIGIIVCTAKRFQTEHDELAKLGAFDFLSKPFDINTLTEKVHAFFNNGKADDHFMEIQDLSHIHEKFVPPPIKSTAKLELWGTRGSIPVSGSNVMHYGGNTSCFAITTDEDIIIFDAGSGIRELGIALSQDLSKNIHLFITHTHWDHIQGFPFFVPAYILGVDFNVYGARGFGKNLENIFRGQLDSDYFPVQLDQMYAKIHFHDIQGPVTIGDCEVHWEYVNHPGATVAYKLITNGKSIVWMPDNEFLEGYTGSPYDLTANSGIAYPYIHIVDFIQGADILVSEAQYTNDEYISKIGWGHSSMTNACLLAKFANVKKWIVTHHDPLHHDDFLHEKCNQTKEILKNLGHPIPLFYGHDGYAEYI